MGTPQDQLGRGREEGRQETSVGVTNEIESREDGTIGGLYK